MCQNACNAREGKKKGGWNGPQLIVVGGKNGLTFKYIHPWICMRFASDFPKICLGFARDSHEREQSSQVLSSNRDKQGYIWHTAK